MAELPTGTVTFLFSDIEDSTRLAREMAAAWPELLRRHQDLLRSAFAASDGQEVSTEGDSFFVAFTSVSSAVAAAVDGQRALAAEPWPEDAAVRVRMGIHTGEASVRDGTYVGVAVHRASRIAQAGHGGQVLLSESSRTLAGEMLPPGVGIEGVGRHRLRGLEAAEEIFQLVIEGLRSEFPALRTADAIPSNLPAQATTFHGRAREIEEVTALLETARLVTLTGPGGTGKTRLSLQVAASVLERFPDGAFFVPLEPIREIELVIPTIAHEIGLPDRGGSRPLDRLKAHLEPRRLLLVLDNFEQIPEAAGELAELLAAAPNLACLVTSRSPLHLYGEQEYAVPPLRVPDPQTPVTPEALSQYEAVALFIDRARSALPSFVVTNENAPAVAEICWRLDGLPLAIELAAARIKLLPPRAILDRLGERLSLLSGGARDLPPRQRTLRGAIEWSYDLLEDHDRRLFAALAAFVGARLGAIEAVADGLDLDVLEGLASLVDKSLVRRADTGGGEPRFTMLETIRDYAMERLSAGDDAAGVWERHAAHFLALAEGTAAVIMNADRRQLLDELDEEHDNLRAVLNGAIAAGDVETAMRLVAALWRFWQMRGHLVEGLERARTVLAMPNAATYPECRAGALDAAGGMAYWTGDGALAESFYLDELAIRRELGDRSGEAWTLYSLAFTDMYWESGVTQRFDPERLATARGYARQAVEIYRELGDRLGTGRALWAEANALWSLAPPIDSEEFAWSGQRAEEALAIFRELGDRFMIGWSVYTIGLNDIRAGDLVRAHRRLREALGIFHEAADLTGYVLVLDALAFASLQAGDAPRAARLAAAVAVLERQTGTGLNPPNRQVLGFVPETLRDDPATADAWAEGERMSTVEAVELALRGD